MAAGTKTIHSPGRGRCYVWPEKAPYDLIVPNVTGILSGGIPKPALAPWNAKMVATFAVKHKEEWVGITDEAAAIDLLKRAPYRTTDSAARAGSLVHNVIEAHTKGMKPVMPKDAGLKKQAQAILAFLDDFKVKPKFIEVTCFSREHEYAGTTDMFGEVTIPKGLVANRPVRGMAVIDYKTGKRIYDEQPVQLRAYAGADFLAMHDDPKEYPVPEVDWLLLVRPKKRGGYEVVISEPTDGLMDLFLAAKQTAAREDILEAARIGRLLTGPDEGDGT